MNEPFGVAMAYDALEVETAFSFPSTYFFYLYMLEGAM